MSFGDAWAVWAVVLLAWGVLGFAVIETLAIRTRDPEAPRRLDTLTSYLQHHTRARWLRDLVAGLAAALLFGGLTWLFWHLWGPS